MKLENAVVTTGVNDKGFWAQDAGGGEWSWSSTGTGGLILWPLFGATNQLLAGLAFLVIAFYLWRRKRPIWFLVFPMLLMLVIPMWAMIEQIFTNRGGDDAWWDQERWMLVGIGLATVALEVWMIIEGLLLFPKARGLAEQRDAAHLVDSSEG